MILTAMRMQNLVNLSDWQPDDKPIRADRIQEPELETAVHWQRALRRR
jgi:hypothetical protein